MLKKNIRPVLFMLAVFVAVLAYFIYPKFNKSDASPWSAVPKQSAMILQIKTPISFIDNLKSHSELYNTLINSSIFKKIELQLNSLENLFSSDESYYNYLFNSNLLICALNHDNVNSVLYVSQIKSNPSKAELQNFLTRKLDAKYAIVDLSERNYDGIKIVDADKNITWYICFVDGLALISNKLEVVDISVKAYNENNSVVNDSYFNEVKLTEGKKTDATLYFNYSKLSGFLTNLIKDDKVDFLTSFSNFAKWTELDLLIKKDELILSGYTSYDSLNLLAENNNNGIPNSIPNQIPFNTNIIYTYSDYNPVNTNGILKFIDKQIAFGSTGSNSKEYEDQAFAIVRLGDRTRAEKALKTISNNSGSKYLYRINGQNIRKVNDRDFCLNSFGIMFSIIKENYYVFNGDYLILANNKETITRILQMQNTGLTLDLNDNYKQFSDNLSSKENVSLYIKPDVVVDFIGFFLNKENSFNFSSESELIKSIHGASVQFTEDNGMAFTNLYLKTGNRLTEQNMALWKIELDAEIAGKPGLVKDHSTNKFMVICYDVKSNLYLINTDGRLLWKKKIMGLPLGEIHQADYYKNGKIQYLFNTKDYLYLIDKKGNFVNNYPKKLNPSSTNALNLFDYNHRKDYRILVSQADKKTYNYTIKGNKVNGWNNPRTANIVNEPIQRVIANKKDYFMITDIDNNTIIVNRRGKERIKIKTKLRKARNSGFYVNRTNSKGIIITTDDNGKLTYIKSSGNIAKTDFGNFSKNHFFLYEDFNADNSVDFIFVDGRKLKVFDRFKKEIFSYEFDTEINIKPVFFNLTRNQTVLGVVSDKEKVIYLFDNKGNTIISRGLVGETPFTVGSLNNNRELNLITASGNTLYNYRLK